MDPAIFEKFFKRAALPQKRTAAGRFLCGGSVVYCCVRGSSTQVIS